METQRMYDPQPAHIKAAHVAAKGKRFEELSGIEPHIAHWFWGRASLAYQHVVSKLAEKKIADPWSSMPDMLELMEGVIIGSDRADGTISVRPLEGDDGQAGSLVAIVYVEREADQTGDPRFTMLATRAAPDEPGDVFGCHLWIPGGVTDRVADVTRTGVAGVDGDAELLWSHDQEAWWWVTKAPAFERLDGWDFEVDPAEPPFEGYSGINPEVVRDELANAVANGESLRVRWPVPEWAYPLEAGHEWIAALDARACLPGFPGARFFVEKPEEGDTHVAVTICG